ncbi:MAG: hypothetical protein K9M11_04410 [Candidatus Pacebacteria bacterium]|nr:hypothetical protein [Candidatus Paceibacterota bacterium]
MSVVGTDGGQLMPAKSIKKVAKKTAKKPPQKIRACGKKPPGAKNPRWVQKESIGIMDALSGKGLHLPSDAPWSKCLSKKRSAKKPKKQLKKKVKTPCGNSPPWDPEGDDDE